MSTIAAIALLTPLAFVIGYFSRLRKVERLLSLARAAGYAQGRTDERMMLQRERLYVGSTRLSVVRGDA